MKSLLLGVLIIALNLNHAVGFWRIETVTELDLQKYAGRWFEMYNSLIQRSTFQRNLYCTTADYTIKKGFIDVVNSGRKDSATGELTRAHGEAIVQDPKEPGKLTVNFDSSPIKMQKANYLVIKLGPVINGQYQYTVITSPLKLFVWVLARNVDEFKAKYESEIRTYLKKERFIWFWNRPRKSYQEKDCTYA